MCFHADDTDVPCEADCSYAGLNVVGIHKLRRLLPFCISAGSQADGRRQPLAAGAQAVAVVVLARRRRRRRRRLCAAVAGPAAAEEEAEEGERRSRRPPRAGPAAGGGRRRTTTPNCAGGGPAGGAEAGRPSSGQAPTPHVLKQDKRLFLHTQDQTRTQIRYLLLLIIAFNIHSDENPTTKNPW